MMAKAASPSAETHAASVDGSNWTKAASEFMKSAGKGFLIRGLEGPQGSIATTLDHTLPQWLAWMGYMSRKGIPHSFIRDYGLATVPAEWPWLFDLAEVQEPEKWASAAADQIAARARRGNRLL